MLPGNIAYVALNTFNENRSAEMFEAAFDEIAKASALIIDLRNNGGGNSSIRVGAFLQVRVGGWDFQAFESGKFQAKAGPRMSLAIWFNSR